MSGSASVAVIGGGLAGIAAAIDLADRGRSVSLFEARPRLGGATYSFSRGGLTVDTGQHVLLRCYRRYRRLLERIGSGDAVEFQDRLDLPVLETGRPRTRLRRSARGPAPLHLLGAIAGYGALTLGERYRAVLTAAALRAVDPSDPAVDALVFGDWLRRHGEGQRSLDRLWGLLSVAALNIGPDDASLALAARVFRTGLLDEVTAGDLGVPCVPLVDLHDRPAREEFGRMGVSVHTGARVRSLDRTPEGMIVRTDSGEQAFSDVVVAVPHEAAARLVPVAASPDRERWAELGHSPIINLHVWYDRRITDLPFAAVLDPELQWVFDRTAAAGADRGQYLVSSLSAADGVIKEPAESIRRTQLAALARVFPDAGSARVLDAFVTREPRATFRQRAGTAALRPPARTVWPELVLAGAWTATGWPDTMEGAVRSGETAARAVTDAVAPTRHATGVSA